MNTNGKDLIDCLCKRLKDQGELCLDSNILTLLRSLNNYEVNQLITFRTIDKWEREKIKKQLTGSNPLFQCGNVEDGQARCESQCEYCKGAKFE